MSVQCRTMQGQRPCSVSNCERPECNPRKTVPMDEFVTIRTARGVKFTVVYGYREYLYGDRSKFPVVSFYDRRHKGHTEYGQFVSDFSREGLMERNQGWALPLNGDDSDWTIDPATMYVVMTWLNHMVWQEEN